ncbi:NADH dehydrogenase [Ceratobasidium theobromae]|uniref:NADH dehydrogenase n=1 Tax=Ceratobasidium theobromae TaxID=1582974 RepID=A0A5N5QUL5_9AGAM|nr:NADH dehydrogenase [Ceratobasidium theobromae]
MGTVVRCAAATLTKGPVPILRPPRLTNDFRRFFPFLNTHIQVQHSQFSTTFPRRSNPSPIPGSPAPPPPPRSAVIVRRLVKGLKWSGGMIASTALGIGILTGGLFLHDAFTYSERHVQNVPVNPLALRPETGGPKNLPIASSLVGDEEDEEAKVLSKKPRLIIVGGGWGAVGVLQTLRPMDYHVTIVSPETYTNFTPLLPSAAVGTVQVRSLIEPLRKLLARLHGHFVCGTAVDVVFSERLLEVETPSEGGSKKRMYIPYDKLVIAVGSVSAQHGVPGLENCFQLKTIRDAQGMRRRIFDNFELASLPTTTPEQRKRLLSFVICGGGPTGVETAAEIYDLCQEDIMLYYPKLLREEVSIHIIQSRHVINPVLYLQQKFARDNVNVITNARVKAVYPDHVEYEQRERDGKKTLYSIPSNFVLWSTGIAMNPFTQRVSDLLPNQVHKKAIETDAHLRVKGAPLGTVYAIGDASTIETSIVSHLLELVDEADKNKDGRIDYGEWETMASRIRRKFPMTDQHIAKLRELFDAYDKDHDGSLSLNELVVLLEELGNKITALPATAQVASQQGKYLGKKLKKLARQQRTLTANELLDDDAAYSEPFKYRHLGSLAYIGNAAVFDLGGTSFMGGLAAMYAWRSVYWSEQVSMRTRALLMIDWIIRGIWGRDLSKL